LAAAALVMQAEITLSLRPLPLLEAAAAARLLSGMV
jgi:hypothetical protein